LDHHLLLLLLLLLLSLLVLLLLFLGVVLFSHLAGVLSLSLVEFRHHPLFFSDFWKEKREVMNQEEKKKNKTKNKKINTNSMLAGNGAA